MKIKIGDTVRLLNEDGQGRVTQVQGARAMVEIDGMELPYAMQDLVKVEHDKLLGSISPKTLKDKVLEQQTRVRLKDLERGDDTVYELDLHIEELLDSTSGLSNSQILDYQMRSCRSFVQEAINKRYGKIVLIHGVGEGILRQSIHHWLDGVSHIEYHDAPYRHYGYGATEVIIHR